MERQTASDKELIELRRLRRHFYVISLQHSWGVCQHLLIVSKDAFPSPRELFASIYWRVLFHLATRRVCRGVRVAVLLPPGPAEVRFAKLDAALGLLAAYGPRDFEQLRQLARGVLVFGGSSEVCGTWLQASRLVWLREGHVASAEMTTTDIATTLVHEIMHARLDARGFDYRERHRARIEAICFRQQAAFSRRLPDGDERAEMYEWAAEHALGGWKDEWTDQTRAEREIRELRELGVPKWLASLVTWHLRRCAG